MTAQPPPDRPAPLTPPCLRLVSSSVRHVLPWLVALSIAAGSGSVGGCASHSGDGSGGKGSGGSDSAAGGSGGRGSGGGASGGSSGSGGAAASGGATGSGGAASSGGTTTSGSSGGAHSGGMTGSAGNTASGGASSSGGATASGGATGSGGTTGSGGVTGSGGTTGSGGVTGSGGAGGASAGNCAAPGLIFCDDFEKDAVAMPPPGPAWTTSGTPATGGGTVAVDGTTKAHSGTKSVHIDSNGAYQTFLELSGAPVFPLASGPVYLRLYLMLAAPMSSGHNTYFKAGPADPAMTNLETRVGVMNAMLMINQPPSDRGVLSNNNYYTDNKPGIVFTPMTWNCIEVLFDPTKSLLDVWVADKEVPDLHVTDWQQSPIGAFRFGFEQYAGPSAQFWYDDIAVGTMPIGCD